MPILQRLVELGTFLACAESSGFLLLFYIRNNMKSEHVKVTQLNSLNRLILCSCCENSGSFPSHTGSIPTFHRRSTDNIDEPNTTQCYLHYLELPDYVIKHEGFSCDEIIVLR